MRRLVLAATLVLAGCATQPVPPPTRPVGPVVVQPQPVVRSGLLGLTAADLVQRFGQPALQVREGAGVKLQFRGRDCVLDAYLYPPDNGQGATRVTHVDARLRSGADAAQAACVATLSGS